MDITLIYPTPLLSELAQLGETQINQRFEAFKAQIRARLDGSPAHELAGVQAQVKLVCEIQNAVLEYLRRNVAE